MITHQDLNDLCSAAAIAGQQAEVSKLILLSWAAGDGHRPEPLPKDHAAVYIFEWNGECLKVGKVNRKSKARYQFQHYQPDSCRSNLARSLRNDENFRSLIASEEVGSWMMKNTTRYNILIPAEFGARFVHFAEAFFILKCKPKFEDRAIANA